MGGNGFGITPHKVSVCILLQMYTFPGQPMPTTYSSISRHNRLGLFLLSLTKSFDDFVEPKLSQLLTQLREINGPLGDWLIDHLTGRLSSMLYPDDLFTLFAETRAILGGADPVMDDNQVVLDPNSNLGMFVRRCVLAFNLMSFEGICHLLTNIGIYSKEISVSSFPYELHHLDDRSSHVGTSSEYENMDLETFVYGKVTEEIEARKVASERVPFHLHSLEALSRMVEDIEVIATSRLKFANKSREVSPHVSRLANTSSDVDSSIDTFLRTNWQVQGYLMQKADSIEKHGSSLSQNSFELIFKQIKNLAPGLHRVHLLRYLSSLYHDDYFAALENLHCYFDFSAGMEGLENVPPSSGSNNFGRYEVALLCLGMMHFYFGHPKRALEVLTEAVRASQQKSNDTCLAYTLPVICNLLFENGCSSLAGVLGTSSSYMTSMGTSLSVEQQLFVLLRESFKRAESLKLKQLVASTHLAMAKFDLKHLQRPLLSFGPRALMKLKTLPVNVCKELRSCSRLIGDFGSESSEMTADGVFSTAWLTNLSKPVGSLVLAKENESGNNSNALLFCVQPSSIPRSVLQLVGSSYLLRATAWETYGSAPLARINALVYASCFTDASSTPDAALVHAKLIQHLAAFKGYKEAFSALKVAEEKFLSISRPVILLVKLQLLHDRALHRGHLKLAQQVCDELGVLASPVTGVDMELKIEASLRHARTLLAANQFGQAAAVAHSLFCMCYKFNKQVENATVLLLLAEIHKKSGNSVLGLPYALASLSFCRSFNLDLLKASATLSLAELWLSLGPNHAKRALSLVHEALPMILGHGGLELCARAHIAEAKCYLSDPSFSVFEDYEAVLDPLTDASEELEVLEYHELAAEAFYLMAIVFDKLGRIEEREEAAASFRKHVEALENPQDSFDGNS